MTATHFESLETRRLMSVAPVPSTGLLTIRGTEGPDVILVTLAGSNYVVTDNGKITRVAATTVKAIQILGLGGNDKLSGTDSVLVPMTVDGGNGNDTLRGGGGKDVLNGGAGNDVIGGGRGADVYNGGAGSDTVEYAGRTGGVTVTLDGVANDGGAEDGAGKDWVRTDVENATGGGGADTITGGPGANRLVGNGGNDKLYGGLGQDYLDGGTGNDLLDGGFGADQMLGGAGTDTLDYSRRTEGVYVSWDHVSEDYTGSANDNYSEVVDGVLEHRSDAAGGIENVNGGSGDDIISGRAWLDDPTVINHVFRGNGGRDTLEGGLGVDQLYGGTGNDELDGGVGHDALYGGDGDDVLNGGTGNDTLRGDAGQDALGGGAGDDRLDGGYGSDRMDGGAGRDTADYASRGRSVLRPVEELEIFLFPAANEDQDSGSVNDYGPWGVVRDTIFNTENAIGGSAGDYIVGDDGDNVLSGGGGNDSLYAGGGNDQLRGGSGDDWLTGATGDDQMFGDAGNDILRGEHGGDLLRGGDGDDDLYGSDFGDSTTPAYDPESVVDRLYGDAGDDRLHLADGSMGDRADGGAGEDWAVVDYIVSMWDYPDYANGALEDCVNVEDLWRNRIFFPEDLG